LSNIFGYTLSVRAHLLIQKIGRLKNMGRYRKTAVLAMKKVFLLTEPVLQVHE